MAAYIIRREKFFELRDAVIQAKNRLRIVQRPDIHFARLSAKKKVKCAEFAGSFPARAIVFCSNKQNMRGYKNPRASMIDNRNHFYFWSTRILLERVSELCKTESLLGRNGKATIVFSRRGRMSYTKLKWYFWYLKMQGEHGSLYVNTRRIDWNQIPIEDVKVEKHAESFGCQMADIVASSFFEAVEIKGKGKAVNPEPARKMKGIVAKGRYGIRAGFGLKLMPSLAKIPFRSNQREIFEWYGYRS